MSDSRDGNGVRNALPPVVVVTGLMAAGKTSVSRALARRLPRSVHLQGDIYRRMIVGGRADMSLEFDPQAAAQLELRYELACEAALAYARLGFTVIYEDVILGAYIARVLSRLRAASPGLVVLEPSLDVVASRDLGRAWVSYKNGWTPETLASGLRDIARPGLWLDTSLQTVEQTVDMILSRQGEIRVTFNGSGVVGK